MMLTRTALRGGNTPGTCVIMKGVLLREKGPIMCMLNINNFKKIRCYFLNRPRNLSRGGWSRFSGVRMVIARCDDVIDLVSSGLTIS